MTTKNRLVVKQLGIDGEFGYGEFLQFRIFVLLERKEMNTAVIFLVRFFI